MAKDSVRNIALTGFMAVGKSAVGRTLARKLGRRFVDLDRMIEKSEGMRVQDIFSRKGESYYRQAERQALAEVLGQEEQVIATGGGVVIRQKPAAHENIKVGDVVDLWIGKSGTVPDDDEEEN